MMKLTFDEWVDAVFNHSKTSLPKYHDYIWHLPMDISLEKEFSYVCRAFTESKIVLAPFSNQQLGYALWYLASSESVIDQVANINIAWSKRKTCIQSFTTLFREIFDKRCAPKLSAFCTEDCGNELNAICYMWWDIFPLWGDIYKRNPIDDEFLDVMKKTLVLENIACQENALHGLGHLKREWYASDIETIIDDYLKNNKYLNPRLREYAQQARTGIIL